jgi:hypothetical protein
MQPSRRYCIFASLAAIVCFVASPRTLAENLTIASSPAGATVEINGMVVGVTPYKTDYPGGFFHKTHTAFGTRLEHSMMARISKDGYLAQQITLTNGPFEWDAITGKHRGNYFLLKSERFEIKLEPVSLGAEHSSESSGREGPIRPPVASSGAHTEEEKTSDSGTVVITSDPQGADIYVDGKFVGQTPSTVHLAAGAHHMEMKINQQSWERDLEMLKDSQLTLHAAFPAQP